MNLNPIAPDTAPAPQPSQTSNGGGESFQLAYANVFGERYAPLAVPDRVLPVPQNPASSAKGAYSVHAGETLSGIARARFAATGVAANVGTLKQAVAQLATANHIGNPDRIYAGQKLDLSSLDAPSGRNQPAIAAAPAATAVGEADASLDGSESIASPHEVASYASWQSEDMVPANHVELAVAAPAQLPDITPVFASAAAVGGVDGTAIAPMAARQVALYEQNAAGAAGKPAEPARAVPDILFKGIAGKMLDAVPIEPSTRADLQRASTIVSSTITTRSLGALTGLGGPLGAVAGLIWGIFSSRQIEAAPVADAKPVAEAIPAVGAQPAERTKVAEALN